MLKIDVKSDMNRRLDVSEYPEEQPFRFLIKSSPILTLGNFQGVKVMNRQHLAVDENEVMYHWYPCCDCVRLVKQHERDHLHEP